MDEKPEGKGLRSREWFARQDKMGFYYRSWLRNRGLPDDQFDGRPLRLVGRVQRRQHQRLPRAVGQRGEAAE